MGVYFHDFIGDPPRTQKGFNSNFVVVDVLTHVVEFIPKVSSMTTLEVGRLFIEKIYVNYGLL